MACSTTVEQVLLTVIFILDPKTDVQLINS